MVWMHIASDYAEGPNSIVPLTVFLKLRKIFLDLTYETGLR